MLLPFWVFHFFLIPALFNQKKENRPNPNTLAAHDRFYTATGHRPPPPTTALRSPPPLNHHPPPPQPVVDRNPKFPNFANTKLQNPQFRTLASQCAIHPLWSTKIDLAYRLPTNFRPETLNQLGRIATTLGFNWLTNKPRIPNPRLQSFPQNRLNPSKHSKIDFIHPLSFPFRPKSFHQLQGKDSNRPSIVSSVLHKAIKFWTIICSHH